MNHTGRRERRGQSGQMLVEFGFMLFLLLAPLLGTLLVVYDFLDSTFRAQYALRYELRTKVDEAADGPFRRIEVKKKIKTEVPSGLHHFIGTRVIEAEPKLMSYGGCYQGRRKSIFRNFVRIRQTMEW